VKAFIEKPSRAIDDNANDEERSQTSDSDEDQDESYDPEESGRAQKKRKRAGKESSWQVLFIVTLASSFRL